MMNPVCNYVEEEKVEEKVEVAIATWSWPVLFFLKKIGREQCVCSMTVVVVLPTTNVSCFVSSVRIANAAQFVEFHLLKMIIFVEHDVVVSIRVLQDSCANVNYFVLNANVAKCFCNKL